MESAYEMSKGTVSLATLQATGIQRVFRGYSPPTLDMRDTDREA